MNALQLGVVFDVGKAMAVLYSLPLFLPLIVVLALIGTMTPQQASAQIRTNPVVEYPTVLPEPVGGTTALRKELKARLNRVIIPDTIAPPSRVWVEFIVNPDSTMSNVKLARSSGNGPIDSQIVDAVAALSIKWQPGMQNDTAVATIYRIPINIEFH